MYMVKIDPFLFEMFCENSDSEWTQSQRMNQAHCTFEVVDKLQNILLRSILDICSKINLLT